MSTTRKTESQPRGVVARLLQIQAMTTGQLRAEFERLSGRPTGSWNLDWLLRKVSWLTQEAERRMSDAVDGPTVVRQGSDRPRSPRLVSPIQVLPGKGVRDPRLPKPGSAIVRVYRGLRLVVTVVEEGFEWNGSPYRSLTAVAKAVTGQPFISGWLFFGLTKRRRGKTGPERRAS